MQKEAVATNSHSQSLMHKLAVDELGFCCLFSFIKEVRPWSTRKVAEAMGVSPAAIKYWRTKKFNGELTACPRCHLPQTQLQLKKRAGGSVYFVRS
jgi:hypothetical protein